MTPVDWGGNTEFIDWSFCKTGEGIEDLLEKYLNSSRTFRT